MHSSAQSSSQAAARLGSISDHLTMSSPIFIQKAIVISIDPSIGIKNDCSILIEGDRITAIGTDLTAPANAEIISGKDCIVTPGFVDCHHHLWQQLLRSLTTDWTLFDYMVHIRSIYGSLFTPEDVYLAQYVAGVNLLSNGITCVLDHCHIINSPAHADSAVKGLKDAGIRGTFCYGTYANVVHPGLPGAEELKAFTLEKRKEDAVRVRQQWFGSNNPEKELLTFGMAPNEFITYTPEQLSEELDWCRSIGARLTTGHVGIGHYDAGNRLIQKIADRGKLGPDIVMSHCAAFTDKELDAVKDAGASTCATPDCDLQMGMGLPVTYRALERGCKTSLGVDITSNQGNHFPDQMRAVLQTQRMLDDQKKFSHKIRRTTEEILRVGTLGGAESVDLAKLTGSVSVGKKADLIVWKCDDVNTVPVINPVGTIVFNSTPSNVDTVIVDGKVVKRNGQMVGVDWPSLLKRVKEVASRIHGQALKMDKRPHEEYWEQIMGTAE